MNRAALDMSKFPTRDTGWNVRGHIGFGEIVSLARQRRSQDSLLIRQMIDVRDRANGDIILPMPDVDDTPSMDPPIPRLITQALDGASRRANGPKPTIVCPAITMNDLGNKRAAIRRRVLYSRWYNSQVTLKLYRSFRHLAAYGTNAWVAMPDDETKTASIEIRDPLLTYPELRAADDIRNPRNVIFIYGRSVDWICSHYPEAGAKFFVNAAGKSWDTLWDIVEYIDENEIVVGIMGPRMPAYQPQDSRPYGYSGYELTRWTNKACMVPAVCPRRITLDRVQGQMSALIPTIDLFTRLTALEVVAAEKHEFPDMYVISADNNVAVINNNGPWRDGRTGEVNTISGAKAIGYLTANQAPFVSQTLGRLEEAIRESGGADAMFGGDNPGGLRTGRALETMGSFAIDPAVQELQRIQEAALSCVNSAVIAIEKGYYPTSKTYSFTGLQGDDQMVECTPAKDLDSTLNVVAYPIPGADESQMSVAIAQMTGSGLMSERTGRVKHPLIDDPDLEERQIAREQFRKALYASVQQQAATGAIPISDAARILELMTEGKSEVEAVLQAHKEAQARQATQAPPPGPGQVGAPESQPGLAQPGAGAEQPPGAPPTIPPPPMSLANYRSLTRDLAAAPTPTPTGANQ